MSITRLRKINGPNAARGGKSARIDKGSGGAFAYLELRRRIVSLDLKPGADLDEATLVKYLGISRTPLRSALVRLSGDGLVVLLPNRGARVASMDLPQLHEHLEAFELAQRAVTRMAALRRSPAQLEVLIRQCKAFETAAKAEDAEEMIQTNWDFHYTIGQACHNRYIEKTYTALLTENLRIARLAMAYVCYGSERTYRAHLQSILVEHRAMVKAIRAHQPEDADALAASHANLARTRVTSYLGNSLTGTMTLAGLAMSARAA